MKIGFRLLFAVGVCLMFAGCPFQKAAQQTGHEESDGQATVDKNSSDQNQLQQAQRLLSSGQAAEALKLAKNALTASPEDVATLQVVARSQAVLKQYADAAATAGTIAKLTSGDPIVQWIQAFGWHLQAGNLKSAESDLRKALQHDGNDIRPHRLLAQLLSAQGRRMEAYEHLIELARQLHANRRELTAMIDLAGPYELVDYGPLKNTGKPNLFDLGKARYEAGTSKPKQALETMTSLAKAMPDNAAVVAYEGRLLASAHESAKFAQWMKRLPAGIQRQPDYWAAIGTWLISQQRDGEAVRALGESLRRNPTDRNSLQLLSDALLRLGKNDEAVKSREKLAVLGKIFRIVDSADAEQAIWISGQLQSLARPWEALGWYRHALQLRGNANPQGAELSNWQETNDNWERQGDARQIRLAQLKQLIGFGYMKYPLPNLDQIAIDESENPDERFEAGELRFTDVAAQVGLQVPFVSDYSLTEPRFYLYQANGGGIGVIDYDLDGRCDVYFSQSGGDPQVPESSTPNQLFRQTDNMAFGDVSKQSMTHDRGFGQGVCAADVNQDGFPDLLVANIGSNAVYLNQGDGTFRPDRLMGIGSRADWTSSIAVADLDGDALPDIVEVNYLDDPTIFQRACDGKFIACQPQRFRAASDRLYTNNGDATVSLWEPSEAFSQTPNYGFGVIVANFDDKHGNDLVISNDGDFNHFWKSEATKNGSGFQLKESAGAAGCSVGTDGISQGCMGIAAGDFDRNGFIDLLMTNFYDEPVNLFLQTTAGFFVDEAGKYDLVAPSKLMLGFGTQASDFDNDGWIDAAILNGHLYDARYAGIGFAMRPQLLQGGPRKFRVQDPAEAGQYWSREQLGRTLASWDFNRDGKMDLIANHLDQPAAVLRNECDSKNWIQLELVGVQSERDAIGAKVVVSAGQQTWTAWQIGGDGYMCTNEPIVAIGLGDQASVDRLEVTWPSGKTQTIVSLGANARYLIVEGVDHQKR